MTDEERNREIVQRVLTEVANAFDRLTPDVAPAPVYQLDDDTRD